MGLIGVVFGPAGTGKSNVVRTVCSKTQDGKKAKGVVYMEIGSPRQFAYHLAKACGVPVEPNWLDAVVSKLFATFRTHITLPSNDEDALALVLPVITEGCRAYKDRHNGRIPVLFIDGVDILAKQKDNKLYVNLVDWAKKCANEDSLRIVLVCSDSHVLALDQQSFKSRLDAVIEIDDVSEHQAVQELMVDKYGFTKDLAMQSNVRHCWWSPRRHTQGRCYLEKSWNNRSSGSCQARRLGGFPQRSLVPWVPGNPPRMSRISSGQDFFLGCG